MLRHALEDGMQRADANGVVMGDDFVVFAAKLGGHAEMGAFLAGDRVAELAQRLHQSVRRGSARQDFVVDKMQSDDFGRLDCFPEVTIHGFTNIGAQFRHGIRLGMDAEAQGGGGESAVGRIFSHFENHFAHRAKIIGAGESGVKEKGARLG